MMNLGVDRRLTIGASAAPLHLGCVE